MKNAVTTMQIIAKNSFSINIKLLGLLGLWIPVEGSKWRLFYPLYSFAFLGLFYTSFLASQMTFMVIVWGDIEQMVGVLFLMVTVLGEYIKMYPFVFKAAEIKSIVNQLDNDSFQPKNEVQEKLITNCMFIVRRNAKYFTIMVGSVASFWGLYPLLDGSYKQHNLPLAVWLPFKTNKTPNYQIAYLFVYFGILLSAVINSIYDTFLTGLMIHTSAQLGLLSDALANIKYRMKSLSETLTFNENQEKEFNNQIIKCIKHHLDILKFTKDFEQMFAFGSMSEFSSCGFVLCVTLFQISLVSPLSFQFLMLALYLICIMCELFLLCWYGNEIILKSSNLCEAAYKSDWHVCGYKRFKSTLLVLMTRLQKPMQVTVFFIPLSIETFMTIVKSSWSFFNLLRQVQEEP